MSTELPEVAVVIPTAGERPGLLRRLIDSVLPDDATSEVIVVLDRRSPATDRLVAGLAQQDARVHLVETRSPAYPERDRGQASRDVGFRHARAEVLLSLDDDLEPAQGLVSGHAKRHADHPGLVVLGYTPVVPADPKPGDSRAAVRLYAHKYEHACNRFRDGSEEVLMGLWGGHFSVRREDWANAERLTDPYEHGSLRAAAHHIDTALGFRLRESGLDATFDSGLVAAHRYRRALRQIYGDSHSVAYGRFCLHAAYPDLVRAPEENTDVWRMLRPALWLSRSRVLVWVAKHSALAVGRLAAGLRLDPLELIAARLLAALGFARGARDAGSDLETGK